MSIGLDGRPLCRRWLGEAVGGGELLRYDAPEEGAFRGMMSNGCRLDLVWGEGGGEGEGAGDSNGAEGGDGRVRPRSAFYKRVVMGELDAARDKAREQPAKLARDARSFGVEAHISPYLPTSTFGLCQYACKFQVLKAAAEGRSQLVL